jgi:hypothetical protein
VAVALHDHLSELQQVCNLPASPYIKVMSNDAHDPWAIMITSDRVTDHTNSVPGSESSTRRNAQLLTPPLMHLRLGVALDRIFEGRSA